LVSWFLIHLICFAFLPCFEDTSALWVLPGTQNCFGSCSSVDFNAANALPKCLASGHNFIKVPVPEAVPPFFSFFYTITGTEPFYTSFGSPWILAALCSSNFKNVPVPVPVFDTDNSIAEPGGACHFLRRPEPVDFGPARAPLRHSRTVVIDKMVYQYCITTINTVRRYRF